MESRTRWKNTSSKNGKKKLKLEDKDESFHEEN